MVVVLQDSSVASLFVDMTSDSSVACGEEQLPLFLPAFLTQVL